jgi:Potential Queuosine, Q, salvage protein family
MGDLVSEIRDACARVAARARQVEIVANAIRGYAAALPLTDAGPAASDLHLDQGTREQLAAFWLTLDAINFGSGWFPTLRKREGRSGYATVATGVRERFEARGRWSATELASIEPAEIATALGQDPDHELIQLFAHSLHGLGRQIAGGFGGSFAAVVDVAGGSAVALATLLGGWECFADVSTYDGAPVPFYKRAQIAAADLARAGVIAPTDLGRLTMFADNLVPHVLRLEGILTFDPELVARIDRGELLEHGSAEEVEIRACALHAVELIVAARAGGVQSTAADVDQLLWNRGQEPHYKASPRHRSRCTAY